MGRFLEEEKKRYAGRKQTFKFFSESAKMDGLYKKSRRPFCLLETASTENLYFGIKNDSLVYFTTYDIRWHDGIACRPSNHLCDSQVCCVNFLAPFAREPEALVALLLPVYPEIREALPLEEEGRYVAFEWIGQRNYLGEKVRGGARRSRGANFTSTDAAVRFRQADGTIRIVLIEWKYTESYGPDNKAEGKSGPTRVAIYRPFFMKPNCPIQRSLVSSFDDLFVEPFYQLMRQQLLAKEMEQAGELSADIVSVLHLAPDVNGDFRRVKSPGLGGLASTATGVWSVLVPDPQAFLSRSVEDVFGHFPIGHYPALQDWWDYIAERYPWTI